MDNTLNPEYLDSAIEGGVCGGCFICAGCLLPFVPDSTLMLIALAGLAVIG
jgi:hypothetical protein